MSTGKSVVALFVVGMIGLACLLTTSVAQDVAAAVEDDGGRLPAGYAAIIKKSQRKQIYLIQDKYEDQIAELKKQIQAIEEERDAEIASVLTADQKQVLTLIRKIKEDEKSEESKKTAAVSDAAAPN